MNIFDGAKEHLKNFQRDIKSTAKIILKSSTKWGNISSVPSVDVDVILTFPRESDMNFIQWLMSELVENVPELSFSLNYHRNADEYALYMTASYKNLLRGAEMLNIRKKVSADYGGGYREFNLEELDLFQNVSEEELFLSTQERQSIVMYWLNTLKAKTKVSKFSVTIFPNQKMIPILLSKRKISQIFPLHNYDSLKKLGDTWVTKFTNPQPLDDIAGYFGIKIALYFAWLGHYTTALFIPTLVGIIGWHFTSQKNMDLFYIFSALFNILWATFYLKHWRRKSNELTYKWGTIDYQMFKKSEERPDFRGETIISSLTGDHVKYYPDWKRQLIVYFISVPVIFLSFLAIVLVSIAFSEFQAFVDHNIEKKNWFSILSPVPKVILALVIGFMDEVFKKIAVRLTDLENHQMIDTHRNYLMTKKILFQFMNSFFSLFYIAFYLRDLVKLREQLATLLITRQFIGNIKEIVMPYINTRVRQTIMGIRYEQRRNLASTARKSAVTACSTVSNAASTQQATNELPDRSAPRPESLERDQEIKQRKTSLDESSGEDNKAKLPKSHGEDSTQFSSSCLPSSSITDTNNEGNDNYISASSAVQLSTVDSDHTQQNDRGNKKIVKVELLSSKRSSVACALTPDETILVQAEEEATLPQYDDPFEDFLEMFIQFGYVSMFASAFPLASLFCLLNNILEIRSDAFKLISSFQRPFGVQVSSIGVWQKALEALSYFAVAVNMGLLAVSGGLSRIMEGYEPVIVVITIFLMEHTIIIVKFIIEQATNNVPFWIENERNYIEHKRREALKALEKELMREKRRKRASSCEPVEDKRQNLNMSGSGLPTDDNEELDRLAMRMSADTNNSSVVTRSKSRNT